MNTDIVALDYTTKVTTLPNVMVGSTATRFRIRYVAPTDDYKEILISIRLKYSRALRRVEYWILREFP